MSGAPKPLTAKVLAELGIRLVVPPVTGPQATATTEVRGASLPPGA